MMTKERVKYLQKMVKAMNRDIIIARKTAFAFGGKDSFEEYKNLIKLQRNLMIFIREQKEQFSILEVTA